MGYRRARRALIAVAAVAAIVLAAAGSAAASSYPVHYDFSQGPQAQSQHPDSPPPGANDWSCRPSAAHPQPVVLVHGLLANQTVNWQTISPVLANRGYCVFSLTYGTKPDVVFPGYQPGGLARMQESARQLSRFVKQVREATGARKVNIVGHSEGSLMPDWYIKFFRGAKRVRRYVGITPLWHGSNPAGSATLNQIAHAYGVFPPGDQSFASCDSCTQFLTGSDFISKLRQGGVAVPGVRYTNIITRNDELVAPYTSGIEPGMTNLIVQRQCPLDQAEHVSMAADPVVAQDVLNALDPSNPAAVPCTAVLPFVGAPAYQGPPR
jgi:triacylglycerol esterase/lipase EstA (alpha/beta hydrolase family)